MRLPLSLVAMLACGSISFATAADISLQPTDEAADHFRLSQNHGKFEHRKEGPDSVFTYYPAEDSKKNSALVTIVTPNKEPLKTTAEKVSVEFRITDKGSFGVQVRTPDIKEQGYLILISEEHGSRGTIKVFKTRLLPPSGNLEDDLIASKNITRLNGKLWHHLQISTEESPESQTKISVELQEIGGGAPTSLAVTDTQDPLTFEGLLSMRFYLQSPKEDDFLEEPRLIEVRRLSVSPTHP